MDPTKTYYLNTNTGMLHIRKRCVHATYTPGETITFDSEQEAYQAYGLTIRWCKNCLLWRENVIRQALVE